jgi:D-ornithine/D-lysine decarboxylase
LEVPVLALPATLGVADGHLCLDGVDIAALAAHTETPFYLYSERRLRDNVAALQAAFRAHHPATEVFYASKACSNLWVLRVVRAAGAAVEVNSGGELEKALLAGFEPGEIVFNGVAKTRAEVERAVAAGVHCLVVDSLFELRRIAEVAAHLEREARVAPRIDVHVPALTHPGLETAHGGKAGIDRDEAVAAFRLAADDPWLDPAGLHLHVGSQVTSLEPYRQAAEAALDLVAEVEGGAGLRLRFLDAGGGFAVPYREAPERPSPKGTPDSGAEGAREEAGTPDYFSSRLTFADYAAAVAAPLAARRPDLALYLEPGRSLVADAAVLVTRVENEKTKARRDVSGRVVGSDRWVTIDAGYNTLLEHTNYAWYFRCLSAGRAAEPADTAFRLAGPLCDGGDVFAGDDDTAYRRFPAGVTVGDALVFLDVGAYTLEMMHPYNARPRAAAYAVDLGGQVVQIRRRESDADLVQHDLTPGFEA